MSFKFELSPLEVTTLNLKPSNYQIAELAEEDMPRI